ncbi:hypothetical protein [Propylenella binzhouense]|nr:hypothetical protein [Propylenella binzhouense]
MRTTQRDDLETTLAPYLSAGPAIPLAITTCLIAVCVVLVVGMGLR